VKTKPQAWFFGTEPPTPVAPWGQGGPSRKMLLGLGVGLLVLVVGGGGAFAAVTQSSGGSNSAGSAGSGLPAFGGGATSPTSTTSTTSTDSATSPPTPPTSSSYAFPDFISAPTDSAAPFTGDSSVLGVWAGQVACGSNEVGILLEAGAAGGDHVAGFWDAYPLSGAAAPASSGAATVGLADSGHLAVRGDLTLVGGGIQVGSFEGTLSADGNDLTGPMSGCGSRPVDLRKQQLLSGAQDPLLGKWSDGQGATWTFTSTGPGQYTGIQSAVSGCTTKYKFTLTGFNDHYAGQAAPLTNTGCTIPITTDLAALDISSQDGSAVVEIDGTPKLTLTKAGGTPPSSTATDSGTATPSGSASSNGASSTSSPSTPGGSSGTS
jgi:hypothetical protein